jgi:meso-butanediol dehydrogenase/(S,S)-butanediol dehydrogenase/diacetyl reductase
MTDQAMLRDKVAIVTGGGSGIGKATAEYFAQEGAKVVVVDWNAASGQETAATIVNAGGQAVLCHADVSIAAQVAAAVGTAVERFGRLDILVNNAAIQILSKLVETSEADWDRTHSVNLKGVFLGCKYAIPAMKKGGGGAIVNIASVLGIVADPDLAAYCAAKGGVISLTRVAALTYGADGIRVNCICPGDVETPLVEEYFNKDHDPAKLRSEIYSKYALRRIASPNEVARVAAFLASSQSSFMTGSAVVMDGGLTIKCY